MWGWLTQGLAVGLAVGLRGLRVGVGGGVRATGMGGGEGRGGYHRDWLGRVLPLWRNFG